LINVYVCSCRDSSPRTKTYNTDYESMVKILDFKVITLWWKFDQVATDIV